MQHASRALGGLTDKELRQMNCVGPDVPGFSKADLRATASFVLHKKKIKKKGASKNNASTATTGRQRGGSRIRQKTVDLPAHEVSQFLQ
jgi:hypothetical protein